MGIVVSILLQRNLAQISDTVKVTIYHKPDSQPLLYQSLQPDHQSSVHFQDWSEIPQPSLVLPVWLNLGEHFPIS